MNRYPQLCAQSTHSWSRPAAAPSGRRRTNRGRSSSRTTRRSEATGSSSATEADTRRGRRPPPRAWGGVLATPPSCAPVSRALVPAHTRGRGRQPLSTPPSRTRPATARDDWAGRPRTADPCAVVLVRSFPDQHHDLAVCSQDGLPGPRQRCRTDLRSADVPFGENARWRSGHGHPQKPLCPTKHIDNFKKNNGTLRAPPHQPPERKGSRWRWGPRVGTHGAPTCGVG